MSGPEAGCMSKSINVSDSRNLSIVLLKVGLNAENFRFLYQNIKKKPE